MITITFATNNLQSDLVKFSYQCEAAYDLIGLSVDIDCKVEDLKLTVMQVGTSLVFMSKIIILLTHDDALFDMFITHWPVKKIDDNSFIKNNKYAESLDGVRRGISFAEVSSIIHFSFEVFQRGVKS